MSSTSYSEGWNDGYNAALDDIKMIGETLIDRDYPDYSDMLVDFLDKLISNG